MTQPDTSQRLAALQRAYMKIEEMKARIAELEAAQHEPIAIVGMAGRFPGAGGNLDGYWRLLIEGRDSITEVPPERWDPREFYDAKEQVPGKTYSRWGGFLERADEFDAQFFHITPREAAGIDPQQRHLLEVAWEALENAGIAPSGLIGSRTGVFVGVGPADFANAAHDMALVNGYTVPGVQLCFCSGRLSYVLGLRGPSMPIETGCSSSLVAIHQAVSSLRSRECDLALAGGVNMLFGPTGFVFGSQVGALARDGLCKTFDAKADGYVRSEGCGMLVLRRLRDAERAGDSVIAVIRGSATNHGGRSSGLTVPNGPAQEAVIRDALENARVSAERVGYVEAHGTGTALGDPIELEALANVMGRRAAPLIVGSVKTNIGHQEAAAGVASVIKVALMLKYKQIPPHLNYRTRNPLIPVDERTVRIPTEAAAWDSASGEPRIAGVSCFGLSGSNVHLVMEEAPLPPAGHAGGAVEDWGAYPLAISAKRPEALDALSAKYQSFLTERQESTPWRDTCGAAARGRDHHDYRRFVLAESSAEAVEALRRFSETGSDPRVSDGRRPLSGVPKVCFVFCGQGGHWPAMGKRLFEQEPTFRATIEQCDALFRERLGWSVIDEIAAAPERSRLAATDVAQPVTFALQVALAAVWRHWGIEPDAVVGHSLGEVSAAHVAGALGLEDAVEVVCRRSRLMHRIAGLGTMAAVNLTVDEAEQLVAREYGGRLAVAAINGPSSVVLSGETLALDHAVAALENRGVRCRRLNVNYAFHSPQVRGLGSELERELGLLKPQTAQVPLVSTVTGEESLGSELDATYWARNLCQPVRFLQAVRTLQQQDITIWLELGPRPELGAAVHRTLSGAKGILTLASLQPEAADRTALLAGLGKLYCRGCTIDWNAVFPVYRRVPELPTYPWQHTRHWLETSKALPARAEEPGTPMAEPCAQSDSFVPSVLESCMYGMHWQAIEAPPPAESAPGPWLIFGAREGLAAALAERLRLAGKSVRIITREHRAGIPPGEGAASEWLRVLFRGEGIDPENGQTLCSVVYLWALDAAAYESIDAVNLVDDQRFVLGHASRVIKQLSALGSGRGRLWLVTRGVSPVPAHERRPAVNQAPIWGFGRACAAEYPNAFGGLVDLDPEASVDVSAEQLAATVTSPGGEDQLTYRDGALYAARFRAEPPRAESSLRIRSDGSYLLTGGLKGLGFEVARWLAARGAGHLIVIGRTPLPDAAPQTTEAHRKLRELEALGASVRYAAVDVSDGAALAALLAEHRASTQPPIRGVVHAASVWTDSRGRNLIGPIDQLTEEQLGHILPPKVAGAWNLQQQLAGEPLDFFLLFSAMAAVISSFGQAAYSAANAFLDTLAFDLRRRGVPALALNLGPVAGVGYGASIDGSRMYASLERLGFVCLQPSELTHALGALLGADVAQIALVRAKWERIAEAYADMLSAPAMKELARTLPAPERSDLLARLEAAAPDARHRILADHLQQALVQIMGLNPSDAPDMHQGLFDIGMDSLLAVEYRNRIQKAVQRDLDVSLMFDYPTLHDMSRHLLEHVLELETETPRSGEPVALVDALDRIDELTEAQVEALLAQQSLQESTSP